jgi:hypothetical protein
MNLESIIIGTAGAALLLAAGALLRPSSPERKKSQAAKPADEPTPSPRDDEAVRALESQLAESLAERDKMREETVDMRQRFERRAEAAEADARRMAEEMDAQKSHAAEVEHALEESKKELEAAHAKAEALERLVEGVRARSRELAEELKKREEKS